jgi:hypothetical protein
MPEEMQLATVCSILKDLLPLAGLDAAEKVNVFRLDPIRFFPQHTEA